MSKVRFAHIADVHLGAFREPKLREANLEAFLAAMDICRDEKVDFILLCGDLFHTSLPDIGIVEKATAKLRETIDSGIPIYVIYGSHDFSASEKSIVDVLHSAGVFVKVAKASVRDDGAVELERIVDERTSAVIAGISGRKLGLDRQYYENLDAAAALEGSGLKIFAFHAALTEMKPKELAQIDSMPTSFLPKGFDYYAGGHVHKRMTAEIFGWGLVVFPGPPFGDNYTDLENGEAKGFYIVTLETESGPQVEGGGGEGGGEGNAEGRGGERTGKAGGRKGGRAKKPHLEFRELPARRTVVVELEADNRTAEDVNSELKRRVAEVKAEDSVVLIKVSGELSSGSVSDIGTEAAKKSLSDDGAFTVYVNRSSLSTKDRTRIQVGDGSRTGTVDKLLAEHLARQPSRSPGLKGESGIRKARELLRVLGDEQKSGNAQEKEEGVIRAVEGILLGSAGTISKGDTGTEGDKGKDGERGTEGDRRTVGDEGTEGLAPVENPAKKKQKQDGVKEGMELPAEKNKRGRKKAEPDQKRDDAGQKKLFDG